MRYFWGVMMCALSLAIAAESMTFTAITANPVASDEAVYVVGSGPSLGSWNPGAVRMERKADDRFTITLDLNSSDYPVSFKFTRGSWKTVEKAKDFTERANRMLRENQKGEILSQITCWADEQPEGVNMKERLGKIQLIEDFYSPQLDNTRSVIVYLPPSYEKQKSKLYPVLYMHDGQNLFDAETSYSGEWGVDEVMEKMVADGEIEEAIVVGIYNNADRMKEYSPWPSPDFENSGRGDKYARFLVESVMPYINGNFRTLSDRDHTSVMGSSMGGLISLYIGLQYPEHFKYIGAMSSCFWWNDRQITRLAEEKGKLDIHFYFDTGTAEGKNAVPNNHEFEELLIKQGYKKGIDCIYVEEKDAIHHEAAWTGRLPIPLKMMLGK